MRFTIIFYIETHIHPKSGPGILDVCDMFIKICPDSHKANKA